MRSWGWQIDEKDCETHDGLEEALQALDAKVSDVRGQYLDTLANWSGRVDRPVDVTEASADDDASR